MVAAMTRELDPSPAGRSPSGGLLLVAALLAAATLPSCNSHERFVKSHAAQFDALNKVLATPPGPADSSPCDAASPPSGKIAFGYGPALKRFVANEQAPRGGMGWALAYKVGSVPLSVYKKYSEDQFAEFVRVYTTGEYVAVVWPVRSYDAKVGSSDFDKSFSSGSVSATVAIHSLSTGRAVCWKNIFSGNSSTVKHSGDAVRAVESDLAEQVRDDTIAAIKEMAPALVVEPPKH
jgi:hypothetical protein